MVSLAHQARGRDMTRALNASRLTWSLKSSTVRITDPMERWTRCLAGLGTGTIP